MAVIGLSDRASLDPRFKEIGRIRKGAAKSGNRPGRDLDHFRYVPDSQHQESAAVFEQIYGKEPTELEVRFPFDPMERVFGSWREEYGQNRLCKLRCDGARWHDWIDGDQHNHSEAGQECTRSFRDTENRCPMCPLQYVGRLSVMLEPMWYAGQIGIVTVITSSVNDIANLSAKLVQWEPLTGKPFRLWRETERIGVPIKGKRAGKDSDLLHLELTEDQLKLEFKAMERRAMARLEAPPIVTVAQIEAEIESPNIDFDGEMIDAYEDENGVYLETQEAEVKEKAAETKQDPVVSEPSKKESDEPEFLTPPEENNWTDFFTRCVEFLNYETPAQAVKIKDQVWLKRPQPSWDALWTHMIEHQAEKGLL